MEFRIVAGRKKSFCSHKFPTCSPTKCLNSLRRETVEIVNLPNELFKYYASFSIFWLEKKKISHFEIYLVAKNPLLHLSTFDSFT
jgi:hypothetical protein